MPPGVGHKPRERTELDVIDHFVIVLHNVLGHVKAAAFLGEPAGDRAQCILCRYNRGEVAYEDVVKQFQTKD